METIIIKSQDGGYTKELSFNESYSQYQNRIVLDPLFWQALCKDMNQGMWRSSYTGEGRYMKSAPRWLWESMNFHEINLTEGWDKAVQYLESIINVSDNEKK